jgi:serine/threonine-protein kinase
MTEGRFIGEVLRRRGRSFDIFDAIDPEGRRVAIKRAHRLTGLDRLRFAREARLGRALRHAGLPEILADAPDWIAFERLQGSLLDGPAGLPGLPPLREIAETLAHLHSCGVVHRDLKPAHVMFRGSRAVLIDLGVAGLVGGTDRLDTGEIVGSPAWMAPEQMRGAAPAPSADIWSFSALAHRLLAGWPLYAGTAEAVFEARRAGAGPRPDFSFLPDRRLADALDAGFAAPSERPSARELATALGNAGLSGEAAAKAG